MSEAPLLARPASSSFPPKVASRCPMDQLCLNSSRSPSPSPNPKHEPADPNLRPVNSTAFKREARKKRKERKRVQKLEDKLDNLLALGTHTRPSNPVSFSNIEWPRDEITSDPIPENGWVVPDPNPQPAPPPSAEQKFKAASLRVQQEALKKCQGFFSNNDESDEEDDDEEEDLGNSRAFEFFVGLFEKDGDLRGFYEKNWEMGEFCCLVCAAVGEKVGKRYVNCVGLVQHANTVTKTKRRGAHRDFGRVVCGVLGWDIDKLPGVLEGKSSVRDGGVQVKEDMQKQTGTIAEVGPHRGVGVGDPVGPDKGDLMDCMGADANTD